MKLKSRKTTNEDNKLTRKRNSIKLTIGVPYKKHLEGDGVLPKFCDICPNQIFSALRIEKKCQRF